VKARSYAIQAVVSPFMSFFDLTCHIIVFSFDILKKAQAGGRKIVNGRQKPLLL